MLLTHRPLRLIGVLIALALPSFLSLSMTSGPSAVIGLAAAPANAGTYNVSYCGNDGVAQNWATYATAPGTSGIACGPGGRMFANLPQQSWGQGSNASLSFTAPDNTTIAGWHPTLRFSAAKTTENTERMVFTAGIPSDPNPPVKCVNLGCPPVITEVPIRAGAKTVNALTRCADERPDYNLCDFTADVTDTGGTITLQDDSAPTARTPVGGSLTTAGAPRTAATGSASVHTLVDDTGSGIASVELQVDGKTAGVGPACAAQPTTKVVPCPLTQDATVNVDTTLIADGRHSVKLVATDASGNATTIWDSTIFVANTPIGPGSPDDLRGAPTAPTATDDARITATWPSTARHPSKRCKSKSFRKSHRSACKSKPASSLYKGNYATKAGATVTGRVTNKTTKGVVAGAPVLLIATPTRGGAEPIRLSATANDNGRYSFKLPRNSGSRNVVITTTARANDVRPAAATNARLLVRSTMRLKVDRKAIRAGRAVHFTASLRDQTPGVPAVLEVYAGGKWRVFQADATKAKGRFRAAYKFGKTGRGTYKFRARARPTSSTPWAYLGAPSSIVKVRVR